jgi:hypothetical protein
MDFNHLRVVLIIYYKCMQLLIHFNAGCDSAAPLSFLCCSYIPTEVPVTNSSRDVW